jgi:hypothetical protein
MTIEGKEKMVVERAYDIDDLATLTIHIYIYKGSNCREIDRLLMLIVVFLSLFLAYPLLFNQ